MPAKLLRSWLFLLLMTFPFWNIAHAQTSNPVPNPTPSAPAEAAPVLKAVSSSETGSTPASTNPQCNNVANQIADVSTMKSANVYPWEDLNWLQQNLGQPKIVKGKENTIYMWVCKSAGSPPSVVMYMINNPTSRVLQESMICKVPEGCTGYFVERNGMNINGYQIKSELFHK